MKKTGATREMPPVYRPRKGALLTHLCGFRLVAIIVPLTPLHLVANYRPAKCPRCPANRGAFPAPGYRANTRTTCPTE
jgi:hypothetical protein